MKSHREQTTSVWMATQPIPDQPALKQDTQADICIVGAGIAGCEDLSSRAAEARVSSLAGIAGFYTRRREREREGGNDVWARKSRSSAIVLYRDEGCV